MVPGLERLRDDGAAAVVDFVPGLSADISAYRVIERRPLEAEFGGMRIISCPPPSLGGAVIARGLAEADDRSQLRQEPLAVTLARALVAGYDGSARLAPLTGTTHVSVIEPTAMRRRSRRHSDPGRASSRRDSS